MSLTNYLACKPLILLPSGYNLKVKGSNPLPAINSLISLHFLLKIFVDSILFYDFL